jgi:hypothetical protein
MSNIQAIDHALPNGSSQSNGYDIEEATGAENAMMRNIIARDESKGATVHVSY